MNEHGGAQPKPIESTRVLIGEGVEDVLFLEALLAHLNIADVQVEDCKGKAGLGAYLKALKSRSGFLQVETLGIVRDADEDSGAAEASVENAILQAAFPAHVAVKKLILPGGGRTGALENLCLLTLQGTLIETCIENYLVCASQATGVSHTTTTMKAKARMHTWLSAQRQPDLRLGHAAKKGFIDWASPVFGELTDFLRDLS